MKKLNYLLFLLGVLSFGACSERIEDTVTYTVNEPVFMSKTEFRAPVKVTSEAKPISKEGKMCFYENYLYISEPEVGIHIIDDRDPANPKNAGFIELLGNTDVAIRNGVLYADSYVDLVWFDISDKSSPKQLGRATDIFPYAMPVTENFYGCDWEKMNEQKETSIIVGWTVEEKTVPVSNSGKIWWGWGNPMVDDVFYSTSMSGTKNETSSSTGVNGSMSRFVFYNDYLYSVFSNELSVFKFNDATPEKVANVYVGGSVETIFSYKDNLFMGTPTGMLIYSVTNPTQPEYLSSVAHTYGCDPVIVEDDKAYVTVRSGNLCGQNENKLFVVDVSDVKNPKEIASYPMTSPKGLGIDNGTLFLCDDGLKVFDTKDPLKITDNLLNHFKDVDGFDVIPLYKILMVIASDGIYQYNYYYQSDIKLLSKLPFVKNN